MIRNIHARGCYCLNSMPVASVAGVGVDAGCESRVAAHMHIGCNNVQDVWRNISESTLCVFAELSVGSPEEEEQEE